LAGQANPQVTKFPQNLNPIEVDSLHGSGRFTLTDRVKFAFNYTQDTWSGATPLGTAPAVSGANTPRGIVNELGQITAITGASPRTGVGGTGIFADKDFKHFYQNVNGIPGQQNDRLSHVMSYASPETRQQGDFKLTYEWDEAALDIGGGISVENDYESRFASLGGRFDFNQKQTTFNWGVSYTNSDTFATLDPDGLSYFDSSPYDNSTAEIVLVEPDDGSDSYEKIVTTPVKPSVPTGEIENTWAIDKNSFQLSRTAVLRGNRQDWGTQLGLTQVVNKNAVLSLDFGYTRSTGYQGNPYKNVYTFGYAM
ncbi:MAG: DUF3570 domain-containing protein, partial [Methylococcaceae bacterium]|nr:DUF3570 domain-containing protein [Methylococcaceae bacterium]